MSNKDQTTFKELEQDGWTQRAEVYDEWFATITNQMIQPFLAALSTDYKNQSFLDICTGTGHLAAAAAEKGAKVEGVDFAETMVSRAQINHPNISFRQGDAEALPYGDESYDIIACSFGLLHFEDADRAIAEAYRILRSDGRYGFTVWCGPDRGGEMFELVFGAVQGHGTMEVNLPPAPPMFRFADPDESRSTLERIGFTDIVMSEVQLSWQPNSGQDVLALIYKSVVRMPMILECQTDEARKDIHRAIVEGAEKYRRDGAIDIGFPAAMVTASKA